MQQTEQDQSDRKNKRGKGPLQLCIQVIGEILITLGVIGLLFIAWQLWWTNVETDTNQKVAVEKFFNEPQPAPQSSEVPKALENPPAAAPTFNTGDTIGLMYIPRFGTDYVRPIIQGTSAAELDTLGLGHYIDTALPGEIGNFAVAGHRQTHGAVFDNIDTLVPGDKIYVQTKDSYYTYVFKSSEIVLPEDTEVILPVPNKPTVKPTERLLTMTTCHPRFGSKERFIAHSKLESKRSMIEGPPDEIKNQVKKASGEN